MKIIYTTFAALQIVALKANNYSAETDRHEWKNEICKLPAVNWNWNCVRLSIWQVTESKDSREWTLHVKSPQAKDTGIYECQVNTEPKMSMAFQLNIIGEYPDIPVGKKWCKS